VDQGTAHRKDHSAGGGSWWRRYAAILERLLQQAEVVEITDKSFRLRHPKERTSKL